MKVVWMGIAALFVAAQGGPEGPLPPEPAPRCRLGASAGAIAVRYEIPHPGPEPSPHETETIIWTIVDGAAVRTSGGIAPSLLWSPVAIGDYNADGACDVLWEKTAHETSHPEQRRVLATTTLNVPATEQGAVTLPANDWEVVGTGDFNGDGSDDVLWRYPGWGLRLWVSSNGGFDGTAYPVLDPMDAPWKPVAVADMDHDHMPDVVWHDPSSGEIRYRRLRWVWGGELWGDGDDAVTKMRAPAEWSIGALADLNGNGSLDFVWQDEISRKAVVWYMSGRLGTEVAVRPSDFAITRGRINITGEVVGPR